MEQNKKGFKETLKDYLYWLMILSVVVFTTISITKDWVKNNPNTGNIFTVPESVETTMDWWIGDLKDKGYWTETMQRRLDAIDEISMVSYQSMENYGLEIKPLAVTTYKVVDDEILPSKIIFSDLLLFEDLGMMFVVFHEMGHAILMLDDITDDCLQGNEDIMWHQGLRTYYKFGYDSYF